MSTLKQRILDRSVTLGVVGLGYVGLPLAVEKAKAGFHVVGFDVQKSKVDMVNRGINYIGDVVTHDLEEIVKSGSVPAPRKISARSPAATAFASPFPPRWTRTSSPTSATCNPPARAFCPICTAIC